MDIKDVVSSIRDVVSQIDIIITSFISIGGLDSLNDTINSIANVFDMVEEQVKGITGNMSEIDKQIKDIDIETYYEIIKTDLKVYI